MIVVKHSIFYLILILVSYVKLKENHNQFLPKHSYGVYWRYFREVHTCDPSPNNKIQFNYYYSKTSEYTVELKGNLTSEIWFDDSYSFRLKIDIKDTYGRWQDNLMLYNGPKACTWFKDTLRDIHMSNVGFTDVECPIPPGVYVKRGSIMENLRNINSTKQYFYGSLKYNFTFIDNNNITRGCLLFMTDILRPWEMPN